MRALYDEMGFGADGNGNINTILTSWQDRMVDRYVEQHFINDTSEQNETLGTVLEFRRQVADIESPLDVLKDSQMSEMFRTMLGIPESTAALDIDRQIKILGDKFDFEKLKDPKEVEKMITRYVAISDALSGVAASTNGAVQLMQSAIDSGSSSSSFVSAVIDIDAIVQSNFSGYKLS